MIVRKRDVFSRSSVISITLIIISLLLCILSYHEMEPLLWGLTALSTILTIFSFHYTWKDNKQQNDTSLLMSKFLNIKAAHLGWVNGIDIGINAHPLYLREVAKNLTINEIEKLRSESMFSNEELDILADLIVVYQTMAN